MDPVKAVRAADPPLRLADLLDPAELAEAIAAGLVRRELDEDGMAILNYTDRATYTGAWTAVTRTCRGLIVDRDGAIVARPWPKFFNHSEPSGGVLDLSAPVEVTDKKDGSLGVLHRDARGESRIATRGSFRSAQAVHATQVYRARYAAAWTPDPGLTYLMEIVYPGNRIVLDYGDLDDLVLLGAVDVGTGRPHGPLDPACLGWPGPRAEVFGYATLAAALAAEPRPGAEGLVVRYLDGPASGVLVKIKQQDYLAVQRTLIGLTPRRIWERAAVFAVRADDPAIGPERLGRLLRLDAAEAAGILAAGPDWADELRRTMPEEFVDWLEAILRRLHRAAAEVIAEVITEADRRRGEDRRTAARALARHPHRGLVFAALDGRTVVPGAWSAIRPEAEPGHARPGA